ncbi:MAG TPA: hydroxyacid dehydrogenase [Pseudolabrys sp.]|jgi:D-3-phosphoglycerate dehydrogenase|nr:hydroxyacid dehydrogenase [Pseudolabrys sp.]
MAANPKIVVRFNFPYDPIMDERFAREPDIALRTCDRDAADGDIRAELAEAHVYLISSAKDELPRQWFATTDLLARCPKLLCISTSGAGYDTVDVDACTKAGVIVVNQAGMNAGAVAEHTLGMILSLSKRIGESDHRLRRERGFAREEVMGRDIADKVLGIIGIGHVGKRVARLAEAFGMTVLAYDPYVSGDEIVARGARPVALDDLLAQADFVSVHCPRTAETLGMIGERAFGRMKRGAMLVTTARGGIVDEAALFAALMSGRLGGAGVDVWDREPPPLDHPLLTLDNVIASFHTAGVTVEARRNMAAQAAEQIVGLLQGGRPPRLVNPEAWPAYRTRFEALVGIG